MPGRERRYWPRDEETARWLGDALGRKIINGLRRFFADVDARDDALMVPEACTCWDVCPVHGRESP